MYKHIFLTFFLISAYYGAFAESNEVNKKHDVLESNIMCNNREFLNCIGISKEFCIDLFIATNKHCDKYIENLNIDGDSRTEMKKYAECFNEKITDGLGGNIDKIDKCGKVLEPVLEERRREILHNINEKKVK